MSQILLGVLIFALIVLIMFVIIETKKNRNKTQDIENKLKQLENILNETNQHLKYKKAVTLQTFLFIASSALFILGLVSLVFLPVFQIKYKLLGITLGEDNFSLFEYSIAIKNEFNEVLKHPPATVTTGEAWYILLFIVPLFGNLGFFYSDDMLKTFKTEHRTKIIFLGTKIDLSFNYKSMCFRLLLEYIAVIACLVTTIINYRKIEFIYITNIHYNELNSVSGYIAIPIICFIISVVLLIVGTNLKLKMTKKMSAEEVIKVQEAEIDKSKNS